MVMLRLLRWAVFGVLLWCAAFCNCAWRNAFPFLKDPSGKTAPTNAPAVKPSSLQSSKDLLSKWNTKWPFNSSKTLPTTTTDKREQSTTPATTAPAQGTTKQGFNILKWWQERKSRLPQQPPMPVGSAATSTAPPVQFTTPPPTSSMPAAVPVDSDYQQPPVREEVVGVVPIVDPPVEEISESVRKHWVPKDLTPVRAELRKFELCLEGCDVHLSGFVPTGDGGVALKQKQADSYIGCAETCVRQRQSPYKSPYVVTTGPNTADALVKRMIRVVSGNFVTVIFLVGVLGVLLVGYTVQKRNLGPSVGRVISQYFPLLDVYWNRLLDTEVCQTLSSWCSNANQQISRIGGSSSNSCRASLNALVSKAAQVSEHALSARWMPDEWAVYIPWSDTAVRIAQDNAPLLAGEDSVNMRSGDGGYSQGDARRSSSRIDIELTVSSRQQRAGRVSDASGSRQSGSGSRQSGSGGRMSTGGSGSRQSTGGSGSRNSTSGASGSRNSTGGASGSRNSTGGASGSRNSTGGSGSRQSGTSAGSSQAAGGGSARFAKDKSRSGFSLVSDDDVEETGSDSNASGV